MVVQVEINIHESIINQKSNNKICAGATAPLK